MRYSLRWKRQTTLKPLFSDSFELKILSVKRLIALTEGWKKIINLPKPSGEVLRAR
jgi:hypothetical protein